jgi:demethylmenaquinone methyltransferase/2-methoxy-6-polyprenyl-1,4-benzoquinol methylase
LLVLEFSAVDVPVLAEVYDAFSFNVIPPLGRMIAGDGEPYRYLVESIRTFPNQERFADMISAAGFEKVDFTNLTGGIAAIHSGWKI